MSQTYFESISAVEQELINLVPFFADKTVEYVFSIVELKNGFTLSEASTEEKKHSAKLVIVENLIGYLHNHNNNALFSLRDLRCAINRQMKAIYVVVNQQLYKLEARNFIYFALARFNYNQAREVKDLKVMFYYTERMISLCVRLF